MIPSSRIISAFEEPEPQHSQHAESLVFPESVGALHGQMPYSLNGRHAEFVQGTQRGGLLGRLFGVPPAGPELPAVDLHAHLEALGVIWALLVQHVVYRRAAEADLRRLLQHALEVLLVPAPGRPTDQGRQDRAKERPGGRDPAVQVDRAHNRFERRRGEALGQAALPEHSLAQNQVLFEPELGIGARISERMTIEASWVHLSHATLFGRQNPGIDNIGARLNFRL